MKIVTWNCNGALRNKLQVLDSLDADVLIVQECEDPSQSTKAYRDWAQNFIWEGETKNKGIGIFAKPSISLERLKWSGSFTLIPNQPKATWQTSELRQFIPFTLNNDVTCLAVWTKGRQDEVFGYMGQFWKFLQIHKMELSSQKILIAGDFNSNVRWDKPDRWWSHSDVIEELRCLGIESLYHMQFDEAQGEESTPTFFHQRKVNKPYHIDYMLGSSCISSGFNLSVGKVDDWLEYSDHMPLSLTY